ncbi:hypothetical protein CDAR_289491 [Caerostris darwini]|uniref:Uncharacterized protein n=1 Tax=Caerostris darwini TaxID=1538125 RepID=A0AAV4UH02_9ARAC|nr:hypothetical protein CDAR_289491 [Caerostris darwini]
MQYENSTELSLKMGLGIMFAIGIMRGYLTREQTVSQLLCLSSSRQKANRKHGQAIVRTEWEGEEGEDITFWEYFLRSRDVCACYVRDNTENVPQPILTAHVIRCD